MGLAYFRVSPAHYEALQGLILQHEADILGPRGRGLWYERPDDYDYHAVQYIARRLFSESRELAEATLELSENEAHSLSMLEIELPPDSLELPPSLFIASGSPDQVKRSLKIARRRLGATSAQAITKLEVSGTDPRYVGYLRRTLRHLQGALPKVWDFFEQAERHQQAVILVDLRARDVEILDPVEMAV
jgi:hypothetical protein